MTDTDGCHFQGQEPAPPAASSLPRPCLVPASSLPRPRLLPLHTALRAALTPVTCYGSDPHGPGGCCPHGTWDTHRPCESEAVRHGWRRACGAEILGPESRRSQWPTEFSALRPRAAVSRPTAHSLLADWVTPNSPAQVPVLPPGHLSSLWLSPSCHLVAQARILGLGPPRSARFVLHTGRPQAPSLRLHREAASVRLPPPRGVWAHTTRSPTHETLTAPPWPRPCSSSFPPYFRPKSAAKMYVRAPRCPADALLVSRSP